MTEIEVKALAPMTDLIARIESADGPSRELDEAIERAVGRYTAFQHYTLGDDDTPDYVPTRYTASIDAALTLVPEGWSVHLHTSEDRPDCEIHITVRLGRSYPTNKTVYGERSGVGSFGMVALALAAAALKARGV